MVVLPVRAAYHYSTPDKIPQYGRMNTIVQKG